ncbi:unnamed protein product [Pieris macdunnoughi]|uniref:C3H1-type domain-containing protein n=1 Tax=Pieris macdunnoughi TaxID=345717 RepID=A0A821UC13_9NEOP|nr:unnamed protein product [Pieris macdunnoughi]
MQKPCNNANLTHLISVQEEVINSNSSPAIKNMKKFIQSKINHTENIPNQIAETTAPSPAEKKPHVTPANVQPPLPLVPPPPDIPWTPVKVKEEVEDAEYKQEFKYEAKEEKTEQEDVKPREVCRDFIRGTCKRVGPCRYAHKFDLSQLVGVFTFCREFQTKRCSYPNCKYVHADVFEEQNFYRTGYLPPRAFAHQKKAPEATSTTTSTTVTMTPMIQNLAPPPPPPEPEEQQSHLPPEFGFSKPPPTLPDNLLKEYAALHSTDPILDMVQSNPLKRSWNSLDGCGLLDLELNLSNLNKCKNCDILEFCLQHSRSKLQKIIVSSEALKVKCDKLDRKIAKLDSILMKVLRPNQSSFLSSAHDLQYSRDILSWEKISSLWNL